MMMLRALVVAAVLAVATAFAATPAVAADDCSDGVVVVIDASAFGKGISTTCVRGAPGSGLDALQAAGHRIGFVSGQPGFICTIDVRPDPCNRAPAHAYWSYWTADQGGSWSYSIAGAGARNPLPGTVDGWRFGDGSQAPGISPPGGEPAAEPEPPSDDEEPASGGSGSGGSSDGSGSSGSGSGAGGSGSGSADDASAGDQGNEPSSSTGSGGRVGTGDRQEGSEGSAASGSANTGPSSPAPDSQEDAHEPDADAEEPDPAIEPAQIPEEAEVPEPLDEPAGQADDAAQGTAEDSPDTTDDVALPEREDGGGLPTGFVAGSSLLAGLAGLTAFQVRRRRLEN